MIIRVPQGLFYLVKMVGDMFLWRARDEINVGKKDRPLGNREKIERDTDRNYFMSAEEAKKYGLIDKVLNGRSK